MQLSCLDVIAGLSKRQEGMITLDDAEFERLLQRGETRQVEMKGAESFAGDFRSHLTASIAAMVNIPDGGTIVVGVDTTATPRVIGLSPEQIASFDPTRIAQYIGERLDLLPRFHVEHFSHADGQVLLIQVTEFEHVPIVVKRQIESAHRMFAREGDILIRSNSCECRRVKSAEELRELLGRALTKQTEHLLTQIRLIMLGSPSETPEKPPSALHQELLPQWATRKLALAERLAGRAWWELQLLPLPPCVQPLDAKIAANIIDTSAVRWRGWYLPTFYQSNLKYFQDYLELEYQLGDSEDECWQLSYRGAFAWAGGISSDLKQQSPNFNFPPPPQRWLSFKDIIFSVTEQFRFAANLAEALACENL